MWLVLKILNYTRGIRVSTTPLPSPAREYVTSYLDGEHNRTTLVVQIENDAIIGFEITRVTKEVFGQFTQPI